MKKAAMLLQIWKHKISTSGAGVDERDEIIRMYTNTTHREVIATWLNASWIQQGGDDVSGSAGERRIQSLVRWLSHGSALYMNAA